MRRFAPGWAQMIAMPMFDDGGAGGDGGNGNGVGNGGAGKDAAYWQAEAKKAFETRDAHKKRLAELEEQGLVITADQKKRLADLEKAAADAEEERKRKQGEFDSWRKDITTKHQTEIGKRDETITTLQKEIENDKIAAAFGAALDLFGGGEKSLTILTPTLASKTFSEYVKYEEFDFGDEDGGKRRVLVVRDLKGKIIRGDGGVPAPFPEAIKRLIEQHPDKDHILRGSGKAGSGARGGSGDRSKHVDFHNLTPEQMRDPAIIEQAKRRTAAAGGIVYGDAWERAKAAKS